MTRSDARQRTIQDSFAKYELRAPKYTAEQAAERLSDLESAYGIFAINVGNYKSQNIDTALNLLANGKINDPEFEALCRIILQMENPKFEADPNTPG